MYICACVCVCVVCVCVCARVQTHHAHTHLHISMYVYMKYEKTRYSKCLFIYVHHLNIFLYTIGFISVFLEYIHINKVKLETVVEGEPKAPFLIATTPRCRGGHYSFPRIASLYP